MCGLGEAAQKAAEAERRELLPAAGMASRAGRGVNRELSRESCCINSQLDIRALLRPATTFHIHHFIKLDYLKLGWQEIHLVDLTCRLSFTIVHVFPLYISDPFR